MVIYSILQPRDFIDYSFAPMMDLRSLTSDSFRTIQNIAIEVESIHSYSSIFQASILVKSIVYLLTLCILMDAQVESGLWNIDDILHFT